jgi:hypothetical protein
MIDLREGPNVPLSFDGFWLSWKSPEWQVNGFATRPVQNEPGFFDHPPQHDFAFWGFYATHPLHQTLRKVLDFYYLGSDLKHAVFNQGAGHEKRHTLGARVWGERGPWAYANPFTFIWLGERGCGWRGECPSESGHRLPGRFYSWLGAPFRLLEVEQRPLVSGEVARVQDLYPRIVVSVKRRRCARTPGIGRVCGVGKPEPEVVQFDRDGKGAGV